MLSLLNMTSFSFRPAFVRNQGLPNPRFSEVRLYTPSQDVIQASYNFFEVLTVNKRKLVYSDH